MIIQDKEIKVYDNGGVTNDRYTIVIDGSVYSMNIIPYHPGYGFNQYSGEVNDGFEYNESWSEEVHDFKELPAEVIKAILQRIELSERTK